MKKFCNLQYSIFVRHVLDHVAVRLVLTNCKDVTSSDGISWRGGGGLSVTGAFD